MIGDAAGEGGELLARRSPMSLKPTKSKLPNQPPSPKLPKAMDEPERATQRTAIRPMAKKFCMSMARMFFERTMPP